MFTKESLTEFKVWWKSIEDTAGKIAEIDCGRYARILGLQVEDDNCVISYEYNDTCNCHPEYVTSSFPIEWLFEEIAIEKAEERKALSLQRQKEYAEEQARLEKLKQEEATLQRERTEFERLKAKFDT